MDETEQRLQSEIDALRAVIDGQAAVLENLVKALDLTSIHLVEHYHVVNGSPPAQTPKQEGKS